jgi:hypothetical protein
MPEDEKILRGRCHLHWCKRHGGCPRHVLPAEYTFEAKDNNVFGVSRVLQDVRSIQTLLEQKIVSETVSRDETFFAV